MIEYLPFVTVSVYTLYVVISELYDEFDMFVSG